MPRVAKAKSPSKDSSAAIGFEATLGNDCIYGQKEWARHQWQKQSKASTRRIAIMNLAIRGIEADIGKEHPETFRNVHHPDLRAQSDLNNQNNHN